MTTVHKNLTGADLHEPKGADTAVAGQVYVSNGSGSGVWTTASSIITNTAFSTGDLKPTHKTVADSTWILWSDGTIGDGSSGATIRANADTLNLFVFYWTYYSDSICPVSGGRGASSAADFANHKTITVPRISGRSLVVAGSGSGLTSRTLGSWLGAESIVLTTANLPPYTPTGSITNGAITVQGANTSSFTLAANAAAGSVTGAYLNVNLAVSQAASTFIGAAQGGTSAAKDIMNPSSFINVMIKL